MSNATHLIAACLTLVLLSAVVALRMLYSRVTEMRQQRIHPQSTATSLQMAAKLKNVQAADNFKNLYEVPVQFYALAALAVATAHVPQWLVLGAWLYVLLRAAHSAIHCTYNKVMHRFAAFGASCAVLLVLWVGFFGSLVAKGA